LVERNIDVVDAGGSLPAIVYDFRRWQAGSPSPRTKSMQKTILSIETSCDETSIALIRTHKTDTGISVDVLAHIVHSQANLHAEFGGVFPALAKREHGLNLVPVMLKVIAESKEKENELFKTQIEASIETKEKIQKVLEREPDLYEHIVQHLLGVSGEGIDVIAITQGPGLEPALWVGINFAHALKVLWPHVEVIPVNHMEGHLVSALFENNVIKTPNFPMTTLLVSGGHTEIIHMDSWGSYTIVGKTRDDAVGEAYDKTARLLGLSYPGGPEIGRLAERARVEQIPSPVELPRPMIGTPDLDFSFSGLKTAVLYAVRDNEFSEDEKAGLPANRLTAQAEWQAGLAREFEEAVADVLTTKLFKALVESGAQSCAFGGGVMASKYLREKLAEKVAEAGSNIDIYMPAHNLTGDNALMIALALGVRLHHTPEHITSTDSIRAIGNLKL